MPLSFWDFHEKGNSTCPACVVNPIPCECEKGFIHTSFSPESSDEFFEKVDSRCDQCTKVDVPVAAEVI